MIPEQLSDTSAAAADVCQLLPPSPERLAVPQWIPPQPELSPLSADSGDGRRRVRGAGRDFHLNCSPPRRRRGAPPPGNLLSPLPPAAGVGCPGNSKQACGTLQSHARGPAPSSLLCRSSADKTPPGSDVGSSRGRFLPFPLTGDCRGRSAKAAPHNSHDTPPLEGGVISTPPPLFFAGIGRNPGAQVTPDTCAAAGPHSLASPQSGDLTPRER